MKNIINHSKMRYLLHSRIYSINIVILVLVTATLYISCNKESGRPASVSLKIDSITVFRDTVVAWDTSIITVYANGAVLSYEWMADKGTIILTSDPKSVRFSACESCKGHRQIICSAVDHTGVAKDTAYIFVKSYFPIQ